MRRLFIVIAVLALAGCAAPYKVSTSQSGLVATRGADEIVHVSLPEYFKFFSEEETPFLGVKRKIYVFEAPSSVFSFGSFITEDFILPSKKHLGEFAYKFEFSSSILSYRNIHYHCRDFVKILPGQPAISRIVLIKSRDTMIMLSYAEKFGPGSVFAFFPAASDDLTPNQSESLDQFYARSEKVFSGVTIN